jgi:hypothetical protein
MLTKLSSVVSALTLCAATLVAVTATDASAAPCRRTGPRSAGCGAGGTITVPGSRGGGGNRGGGGGGLTSGPGNGCGAVGGVGTCPIAPPPAAPPPPQDPTVLAEDARAGLELPEATIHTSPSPRTYVRLRTGLWINQGDLVAPPASASAAGQTVRATATARTTTIVWDMGEGRVVCQGAGSPTSTACGYTYKRSSASQPGGKYRITVTITWDIHWVCSGNCPPDQLEGDLDPLTPPAAALLLPVDEIQNVSQPG